MKKAILFAAAAVMAATFALTGCGGTEIIEYIYTDELIFCNRTDLSVKLESYDGGVMKALWTVEPGTTVKQTCTSDDGGGWGESTIRSYEKVRVVFGDAKELWSDINSLDTPYNLYSPNSCTVISYSNTLRQYIYELDEAMMNTATPIVHAVE